MNDDYSRNRALARYVLLPTIFLTVALLGGLRVGAETGALLFIVPPLVTLILATLLLVLAARGSLIEIGGWLNAGYHPLTNIAHALTLAVFFFASAQAFNSVLPERGLLRWMLSFFFLWTLWGYLLAPFDARRLVRSLGILFGTAFVLKHMLLASVYEPAGGFLKGLAGVLLEGVSLGTLDAPAYAPATGYISFFTLALYVGGLLLLPAAPGDEERENVFAASGGDLARPSPQSATIRPSSEQQALSARSERVLEMRESKKFDVLAEAEVSEIDDDNDERTLLAKDK